MTWEGVESYQEMLLAFIKRHNYDVAAWDGKHGYFECYQRNTTTNTTTNTCGNWEPFEQIEYVAGSPIDLDWEITSEKLDSCKSSFAVAVTKELGVDWLSKWFDNAREWSARVSDMQTSIEYHGIYSGA